MSAPPCERCNGSGWVDEVVAEPGRPYEARSTQCEACTPEVPAAEAIAAWRAWFAKRAAPAWEGVEDIEAALGRDEEGT